MKRPRRVDNSLWKEQRRFIQQHRNFYYSKNLPSPEWLTKNEQRAWGLTPRLIRYKQNWWEDHLANARAYARTGRQIKAIRNENRVWQNERDRVHLEYIRRTGLLI